MGSVIDYIECPNCKQPDCHNELYYKSGEEYTFCDKCGYIHEHHYKRDEKGKLITKDGTDSLKFTNLIMVDKFIDKPFGVYTAKGEGAVSTVGVIETEEDYKEFLESIEEVKKNKEKASITFSRFVNNKITEQVVYNNL